MRLFVFIFAALAVAACRAHMDGDDSVVKVDAGVAKTARFAWSRGELPTCFSGRFGTAVFVFDQQRDFQCDGTTSSWK